MIILITGASHTGKTLLAQRMLEKYKFPYLSIDHLKMGLIRSGKTSLTPEDDNALTDYLWPIVREMIKTAIENRQNLIVEGCYIPSDWRKDFDEQYLQSIRFICLSMTDEYIDAHFDEIRNHASDIERRQYDADITPESLKADNHYYFDSFRQNEELITLIDTDFELTIRSLLMKRTFLSVREPERRNNRIMNGYIIEKFLDKPYWVIDILPQQVPADGQGQYFKIEEYWLKDPQFSAICNKFSNLLIKLNCYYDVSIYYTVGEWTDNPSPETITDCLSAKKAVYVVLNSEDAMIGFIGDDHYMTLYNPNERLLEFVKSLANSVGLFVWEPEKIY